GRSGLASGLSLLLSFLRSLRAYADARMRCAGTFLSRYSFAMRLLGPLLCVAAAMIAACSEPPACRQTEGKYYDEAVSRQLKRDGVRHTLDERRGVCVPVSRESALLKAQKEVDPYFHEVATLL